MGMRDRDKRGNKEDKRQSKKATYPDNCLSKEVLPGKSLFVATLPIDSFFSLASLCSTNPSARVDL